MAEIDSWIESQLKKGYTIKEAKSFLIKKGYPSRVVKQVDKFKDKTAPQKTKNYKPLTIVAIAVAAALLTLWLWPTVENSKPETKEETASPEAIQTLCKQFITQKHNTPCETAAQLALYDTPGTLQDITTGTMQIQNAKTGETRESRMWQIDITPQKQTLSGEGIPINTVRISIGLEKDEGVHRKYIT